MALQSSGNRTVEEIWVLPHVKKGQEREEKWTQK
jgi:hypothetical protein